MDNKIIKNLVPTPSEKMQITTKPRFDLTPEKVAIIAKLKNKVCTLHPASHLFLVRSVER